jgi:hypothetical protein
MQKSATVSRREGKRIIRALCRDYATGRDWIATYEVQPGPRGKPHYKLISTTKPVESGTIPGFPTYTKEHL